MYFEYKLPEELKIIPKSRNEREAYVDAMLKHFGMMIRGYGGNPQETCMAWGFAIGNGWLPLLANALFSIKDELGEGADCIQLTQVKEKFGTLRIYSMIDELRAIEYFELTKSQVEKGLSSIIYRRAESIIGYAARESAKTCEECGAPGEARSSGWIRTLCDSCNIPKEF